MRPSELLDVGERWRVGLALALFGLISWQVAVAGPVTDADDWVYQHIGAHRPALVVVIADLGSRELSGVVLAVAAVSVAMASGRWWPAVLGVVNGLAVGALVWTTKASFARSGPGRPRLSDTNPGYYPSGHTAAAAVCLGTAALIALVGWGRPLSGPAGRQVSATATWIGISAGSVVGAMTVVTANHWLSDVAGSLALATALLTVSFAVLRRWAARHRL